MDLLCTCRTLVSDVPFCDFYATGCPVHWRLYKDDMCIFFYLSFVSRTFTSLRTAGKGVGYPFNSSLTLPPNSQTLRH